eukprot:6393671-Amphidinium_carterae.2
MAWAKAAASKLAWLYEKPTATALQHRHCCLTTLPMTLCTTTRQSHGPNSGLERALLAQPCHTSPQRYHARNTVATEMITIAVPTS